ncbi:MAG: hypothetical protein K8963_09450, partial [Proteobacteria bacterium]|nr:hypothetical protein [Pseudomonadota bacterium]
MIDRTTNSVFTALTSLLLTATLAACGGGGSAAAPAPTPTPTLTAPSLANAAAQTLTANTLIQPILFANTGGAVG